MSYKKILIISQMFLFNSMFSEEKVRNNEILGKEKSVNPTDVELQRISQEVNEINKNFEIIKLKQEKNVKNNTYKDFLTANSELEKQRLKDYGRTKLGMNNIFLLKEGENTNFFADENGALMIKLLKIKNDNIEKIDKDYLNFYNKKNKEDNNTKDLDKIFEQRFAVENYKDIWM